ncbi:MAG: carboxylate--amine ligase [Candidatus Daviesbacteria bacterium]|nr:carboxylate--amine ligase [Candidatus Daviesbacteria bacterium]
MNRILITGIGGSAGLGFVNSLKDSGEECYIIGCDSDKYSLERAKADEKYLVPLCRDKNYLKVLKKIIRKTEPDLIYSQVDVEIEVLSENREIFEKMGVKTFWPSKKVVKICQNKHLSYLAWKKAGMTVPNTILIDNGDDLKKAIRKFGLPIWIREIKGAFGKGSLPANSFEEAAIWIDAHKGWGKFSAAELLDAERMVTWQSIWYKGNLIIAQSRKRLYWEFANRVPSGVTGLTGAGITVKDKLVDKLAIKAIKAIDKKPHGIFSVDFTYNKKGIPNPTEINIGRFFTTHYFFTKAGLNMPYIYVKLALKGEIPKIKNKINPLKAGLVWIRGLDFEPILTTIDHLKLYEKKLKALTD